MEDSKEGGRTEGESVGNQGPSQPLPTVPPPSAQRPGRTNAASAELDGFTSASALLLSTATGRRDWRPDR
jgi:hypothetical protein